MKQIQPVSLWYNGQMVLATIFNMNCSNDNLVDSASFYYVLYVDSNYQVANGQITMSGADYITYSTSPNANEFAYQWGATQLNLILV